MANTCCQRSMGPGAGRRSTGLMPWVRLARRWANAWLNLVVRRQLRRVRLWERASTIQHAGEKHCEHH